MTDQKPHNERVVSIQVHHVDGNDNGLRPGPILRTVKDPSVRFFDIACSIEHFSDYSNIQPFLKISDDCDHIIVKSGFEFVLPTLDAVDHSDGGQPTIIFLVEVKPTECSSITPIANAYTEKFSSGQSKCDVSSLSFLAFLALRQECLRKAIATQGSDISPEWPYQINPVATPLASAITPLFARVGNGVGAPSDSCVCRVVEMIHSSPDGVPESEVPSRFAAMYPGEAFSLAGKLRSKMKEWVQIATNSSGIAYYFHLERTAEEVQQCLDEMPLTKKAKKAQKS